MHGHPRRLRRKLIIAAIVHKHRMIPTPDGPADLAEQRAIGWGLRQSPLLAWRLLGCGV
jgi:hypothetical protein